MKSRVVTRLAALGGLAVGVCVGTLVRAQDAPSSALSAGPKIDAATRGRVIDSAIADLDAYYVFPEVATRMGAALRAHQKRGDYNAITEGKAFADTLTADLRAVSRDRHLAVTYSREPLPKGGPQSAPDAVAAYRKRVEFTNCGFERVEWLPGNVGYLKFNAFPDPEVCGQTAIAAMNLLAHVDALIIDLRTNHGGDPAMIALLCTYLFAEPTHLNDIWERRSNATRQYWTLPYVPGSRLSTQPVYVLTSKETFSGAEEFTYDLKNLKRATIIGERTGGGAHPVMGHRIDDHFVIGVPFARAINPISKTNWEGVGVEPDIPVAAADALTTAERIAAEKIGNGPVAPSGL